MEFPRDYGAHLGHRIEWWYVTGHLESDGKPLGFQVTFFRVRNKDAESNPSRFAPKQILFAHAALADPARGSLLHAQKSGRFLEGLVEASTSDTRLRLDDWSMAREAGRYTTKVAAQDFTLDLALTPTGPMILQGERGFSRKGETEGLASYYYSEPQLAVTGRVTHGAATRQVKGVAWLDHEWSSEPLAADAAGWDWLGVNLDDGGALMAFRIRRGDGSVAWSHASVPGAVAFKPMRHWRSPRTGVAYPVAMEVQAGGTTWTVEPLMDDQELDARGSTGTLYWEGAVRVRSSGGATGRGYLELTGYGERVPF